MGNKNKVYFNIFAKVFTKIIQNSYIPSHFYNNVEIQIRDEKFQYGTIGEKYLLIDAILNRRKNARKNLVVLGEAGSGKTLSLVKVCSMLLEEKIPALFIPCYQYANLKYSMSNYISCILAGDILIAKSELESILGVENLILLFDGYDEISEKDKYILKKQIKKWQDYPIQIVVSSREIFDLDECSLFDFVYIEEYLASQIFNKVYGKLDKNHFSDKYRNISSILYKNVAKCLENISTDICIDTEQYAETANCLLGIIGMYLFNTKKNYISYKEFNALCIDFNLQQNRTIFQTIKDSLFEENQFLPQIMAEVIFVSHQLCDEIIVSYLLFCLRKRKIMHKIDSIKFPDKVIQEITENLGNVDLINAFNYGEGDNVFNMPCFLFDTIKKKYDYQLQQFEFRNVDFSNIDFIGCRFTDGKKYASFENCIIPDLLSGNVGMVNSICILEKPNIFAISLSDKTVQVWDVDKGYLQNLNNENVIIMKLEMYKNFLIGLGVDQKIYIWEKWNNSFKTYIRFDSISDVLINYNKTNAFVIKDKRRIIDIDNNEELYYLPEDIKILSYIWDTDKQILVTTQKNTLVIDLEKKNVEKLINVNQLSLCKRLNSGFIAYNYNSVVLLQRNDKIYNKCMLNEIIVTVGYSKSINGIIAVCKKGEIILLDEHLNIKMIFKEIRGRVIAGEIYDQWIYLSINDGNIVIVHLNEDWCFEVFKKFRPLYGINILGCRFENTKFKDSSTLNLVGENGGIVKYI